MIKNSEKLRELEDSLSKKESLSVLEAYKLLNSLYRYARTLGVFPLKDPLLGLESDLELARKLNNVRRTY